MRSLIRSVVVGAIACVALAPSARAQAEAEHGLFRRDGGGISGSIEEEPLAEVIAAAAETGELDLVYTPTELERAELLVSGRFRAVPAEMVVRAVATLYGLEVRRLEGEGRAVLIVMPPVNLERDRQAREAELLQLEAHRLELEREIQKLERKLAEDARKEARRRHRGDRDEEEEDDDGEDEDE